MFSLRTITTRDASPFQYGKGGAVAGVFYPAPDKG